MDDKNTMPLPRRPRPYDCRRLVSALILLGLGTVCGVLIGYYVSAPRLSLSRPPSIHPRPQPARKLHEPPPERPGKSIKKDMSVQFRQYIPRKVFLNVGGRMPDSLDLFLDTYPHSADYHLYTFLTDPTYEVFYAPYTNHTLVSPVWVTGVDQPNKTRTMTFSELFSNESFSRSVKYLDLAVWIKDNTKQDDYVILKMDSPEESDILERFVSLETIEWIDKYYTVEWSKTTLREYEEKLRFFNVKLFSWDAVNGTYSDFDEMNPTHVPPIAAGIQSSCLDVKHPQNFAVILYISHPSLRAIRTLRVLRQFQRKKSHVAIFLPMELLVQYYELVADLSRVFHGGVVLENTDMTFFALRNTIVKASHIYQNFPSHPVLQFFLTLDKSDATQAYDRVVRERHVTIFNVTDLLPDSDINISNIQNKTSKGILAIDISRTGSNILVINLLKKYQDLFINIAQCVLFKSHGAPT